MPGDIERTEVARTLPLRAMKPQSRDELSEPVLDAQPSEAPTPVGVVSAQRLVRLEAFEEAVALPESERAAYRRRFTTLFVDENHQRKGGLGRVMRATNARGEEFALKVLTLPGDCRAERPGPTGDELDAALDEGEPSPVRLRVEALKAAFAEEYACHQALSALRGFPTLYGRGEVDGAPALVMEWVEGETLARARHHMAIDDEGRLSPLTAAQLGRDLFGLLSRMELVGEGYVHRDISPANVMVRTSRAGVEEQERDGAFDLCLIDFGSAAAQVRPSVSDATFTSASGVVRRATPAYAPPEMLTEDLPDLAALRRSPAVDVYEAASVVYDLACGHAPFARPIAAEKKAVASFARGDMVLSPYLAKTERKPVSPVLAHARGTDVELVLSREPQVASLALAASAEAFEELGYTPGPEAARAALERVDAQLGGLLLDCLASEQGERPAASCVRDALAAFCARYGRNVSRALRGERLLALDSLSDGTDVEAWEPLHRALRVAGMAVCGAAWLAIVGSASLTLGKAYGEGEGVLGPMAGIALVLALPALAGYAMRGKDRATLMGFAGGSVLLLVFMLCEIGSLVLCPAEGFGDATPGMVAACVAASAAAWCPMVIDYVTLGPGGEER